MPDLDVADYLFFTIVRHPLARAISLWDHCVRLERVKVDFEEYVWDYLVQREKLQLHFVPRHLWLSQTQCEWLDGLRVDRVLKLESLEEDFNVLPFVQESVSIPRINEGAHKDVAVSGRARDGVYEWAQKDFEEFSFTPLTNPSDTLK
jgi:hypothetical protein